MQREIAWSSPAWEILDLPSADVRLLRAAIGFEHGMSLLRQITDETPWRQDTATIVGKQFAVPRLQQWVGDRSYAYSGMHLEPTHWTMSLSSCRSIVQELTDTSFDAVFLNLYRDGNDCIGWHADDKNEGKRSVIASLSLGCTRSFQLRRKDDHARRTDIELRHGDLLVMRGDTQDHWEHCVPRRAHVASPRLNLTFRQMRDSALTFTVADV